MPITAAASGSRVIYDREDRHEDANRNNSCSYFGVAFSVLPAAAQPASDEAKIRALEAQFAAAFNAKDADAIMKVYVPNESLVVFDVVPPRQYVGANAYRKDWQDFFAHVKGPLKFEISDLGITTDGNPPSYWSSRTAAREKYRALL